MIIDRFVDQFFNRDTKSIPTPAQPLSTRINFYGYLCYFIIAFALLTPFVQSNYCHFDEMMLLSEAKRIMHGELQHCDFFSFYGGGEFYIIVIIWKIIGQISYQSIKLLTYISIIFGGILLLLTTRRFTNRFWLALLPSFIFVSYHAQIFPFSNHHWFGSIASIIYCFFIVRFILSLRMVDLYLSGCATGLTLFFIMSEGIINLATSLAIIFIAALLFRERLNSCQPIRLFGYYLAGLATIMLPIMLGYYLQGVFLAYLHNTFVWPFANYAKPGNLNDLPWAVDAYNWRFGSGRFVHWIYFFTSSAILIVLLMPVLSFILSGALLISPNTITRYFKTERIDNSYLGPTPALAKQIHSNNYQQRYDYFIVIALFLLAASLYIIPLRAQPEFIKLLWGSVRAFILGVFLLDRIFNSCYAIAGVRRAMVTALLFIFLSLTSTSLYNAVTIARGDEKLINTPETNHMIDQPIVDMINQDTTSEDYVFAYNYRLTFLYFLLNARPATDYTLMTEDYLSPAQERKLMADLYQRRPKYMAFSNEADLLWISGLQPDSALWLNQNYQLVGRAEGLLLYKRK